MSSGRSPRSAGPLAAPHPRAGSRPRAISGPARARPLSLALTPEQVVAGWPAHEPLAAAWSEAQPSPDSPLALTAAGWTILARPVETWRCRRSAGGPVWRCVAGPRLGEELPQSDDPLGPFARLIASHQAPPSGEIPPFAGGWIGSFGYDFGGVLEPAAVRGAADSDDRGWPLAEWHRCPGALAHRGGRWWAVGDEGCVPELDEHAPSRPFACGGLVSTTGREAFEEQVARAVEYIRAGDIFQANIAHRLSGTFGGSARALFLALVRGAAPWHGAYLESPDGPDGTRRAIASASPELFLDCDPRTRRIVTRPMKGTRPGTGDAAELMAAPKDRAELNMIVDLMRNDLGRVSRFGSVRVEEARAIEQHGQGAAEHAGVLQAVATVSGELREGLTLADLLRAAFPGGSVTGAPKIRAMQIIGGLEPVARGPYCGSAGFVSDCGRASLNVAIRTALLTGRPAPDGVDAFTDGTIDYSVGAGIVADSVPEAEWRETMDKAGVLRAIAEGVA